MDWPERDREFVNRARFGAAAIGVTGAIAGGGLLYAGMRSGHISGSALLNIGRGVGSRLGMAAAKTGYRTLTHTLPDVGRMGVRGSANILSWLGGGDFRPISRNSSGKLAFNPAMRNKIFAGLAVGLAAITSSGIRGASQSQYYTDYETMEQRRMDDLGATGMLAFGARDAMRTALHAESYHLRNR
jgi:hypothetical protein